MTWSNLLFELYVFDVWLGQSIFFRPINYEHYNVMIDVWHVENKHPIDYILSQNLLPKNTSWYHYLGDLVISNYDHDHFSGLPYLRSKVIVNWLSAIKSITPELLNANKPEKTDALSHLIEIKKSHTSSIENWNPPYKKRSRYLPGSNWKWNFNNFSQITFIEYWGFNICIPWDLEKEWWEFMLQDQEVLQRLQTTQIFVASHHGRENWYMKEVFDHCKPNLIIISDKEIMHSTQETSSDVYGKHVVWDGVQFDWNNRKVISTRNDWSFVFRGHNQGLQYTIDKINF